MLDIDDDLSRKITKFALIGYAFLLFLSPAQPLLCSSLMGVLAVVPILLGPNPLRVLGLLAFAMAGYLFWPEYQESKKLPTRNEVRQALLRADPLKLEVAKYAVQNKKLPDAPLDSKPPNDAKADYVMQPAGVINLQLKFAPLEGRSVRWIPTLVIPSSAQPGAAAPPPRVTWACLSDDIMQSYLPGQCRNSENLRRAQQMQK